MGENVAIFGITGALGREIQVALESEQDAIARFFPVAGTASAGTSVPWRGAQLPVLGGAAVDPRDVDVAIFACRANTVRREAPRFARAGVRIIDASGTLSRAPLPAGVPLDGVVGWPRLARGVDDLKDATLVVLPDAIAATVAPVIDAVTIASQSDVGLLPPLASIDLVVVKAASAAGRAGIDALSSQAVRLLNYQSVLDPAPFDAALAFNLIATANEDAMVDEAYATAALRALFPDLAATPVNLVTLQAGVFSGLAVVATLRFASPPNLATLATAFESHPDLARADVVGNETFDDEEPDEETPAAPEVDEEEPGSASLRDAIDSDAVRFQPPTIGPDGAVRVVLLADPLHRAALVCQTLLAAWMDEEG
jgi:aspartate-semialdehyde dehydrogenase